MRQARRFAGPLGVLATVAVVLGVTHTVGLRLNVTPSLPRGVYFLRPGVPARGTHVAACLPAEAAALGRQRGYLGSGTCANESAPVLKLVAASAGDVVEIGTDIRVNGTYLQPAPPIEDRAGRPLDAYPTGRYVLGWDEVWLYSLSPHSWDSRFFGPVSVNDVLGVVQPIWTWGGAGAFPRESPKGRS